MKKTIRDLERRPLYLTSTELIEGTVSVSDFYFENIRWAAYLKDIEDGKHTQLHDAENAEHPGSTKDRTNFEYRTIGCRKFGKKTFETILAAIKKAKKRK